MNKKGLLDLVKDAEDSAELVKKDIEQKEAELINLKKRYESSLAFLELLKYNIQNWKEI